MAQMIAACDTEPVACMENHIDDGINCTQNIAKETPI